MTELTDIRAGVLCRRGHAHENGGSLRYRSGACVQCQAENAAARRAVKAKEMDAKRREWASANPEKIASYEAKYLATHREAKNTKARARMKANLPKLAAKQRAYRKANPEKLAAWDASRVRPPGYRKAMNAYRIEWAKRNPGKVSEYAHKRSGTKLHRLPRGTLQRIGELQRWKCTVCTAGLKGKAYHKDHILPLALGGKHEASNIQLLCPRCNMSKGAKHPVDFMQQKGMLL